MADDEVLSFEELGVNAQLTRALLKRSITTPTPIQRKAIPLILEGKDVIATANTGSGKTFAYMVPLLQKFLTETVSIKTAPSALILVPTKELCQQVASEALSLLALCWNSLKVVQLTSDMSVSDMGKLLSGPPDIVVSTPTCILTCLSKGALRSSCIKESLSMLVLDEADLLLSYRYEVDLDSLICHIPRRCQCLLMSATSSPNVEKLKNLVLHNPVTLGHSKYDAIPKNIEQFYILCSNRDKLLYLYALLNSQLLAKKVLIFVNTIDMGYKIRLFLEQFHIRSALLNAELPQNSRLHILEEFNAAHFDLLIATDDTQLKEKQQSGKENQTLCKSSEKQHKQELDAEFGVVRGIDFKNVFTVINFDMPRSFAGYLHRVGRTGRAQNTGSSVSLISPEEKGIFKEVKVMLGRNGNEESSNTIAAFDLLTRNAVENLRYRAEDVSRGVTASAARLSRAQDFRNELLNSEHLEAYFEDNPKDLELLKHDKLLGKKTPPAHLRVVPEYLEDSTTKEASKIVKLNRAAMEICTSKKQPRFKKGLGRSKDPLKTFSAESGWKRFRQSVENGEKTIQAGERKDRKKQRRH